MGMEQDTTPTEKSSSRKLHEDACSVFPGGVSHNVRATEPYPIYIERTDGPFVYDVDGNRYVDFWNNHAASLLGHTPDSVVDAVQSQAADGLHYGAMNEPTLELGMKILEHVPTAERVRFCASGTEATMYAVRLARAYTGNDRILKVEGGWHGANSDLAIGVHPPFDQPTTHGLPPNIDESCLTFEENNHEAVIDLVEANRGEIAGLIIDPRKGGTEPTAAFLELLSDLAEDEGFLLIFDEVVTGFRVSPGSYQERVGITPDLTTLGKVIGGGMPVGALCGRADIFEPAKPNAPPETRVLAGGGTFSANPMTAVAGLATIEVLESEPVYEHTERLAERLRDGLDSMFEKEGVTGEALGFSSLIHPAFNAAGPIESLTDAKTMVDHQAAEEFCERLYEHGYYTSPGSMWNVSFAHTDEHIDGVLEASRDVIRELKDDGHL